MAEVEFTWALDGYCARYGFLAQPEGLTMREAARVFQLDPQPPEAGTLNDYITAALRERNLDYFSFFLHHYETRLNGRVRRFLMREGLERYDPERFLDYKMGCVLAMLDCLPGYDPMKEADFLTYAHYFIGNALLECRRQEEAGSFQSLDEYKAARGIAWLYNNSGKSTKDVIAEYANHQNCTEMTAAEYLALAQCNRSRVPFYQTVQDEEGEETGEDVSRDDSWNYADILWNSIRAKAVREAFEKLDYREQTLLEKRNAVCMTCGRVSPLSTRMSFEDLAVQFEGSTASGAERAYRKATEKLTLLAAAEGAVRAVRIKQKAKTKRKKKIAAAVYEYQADCDGEWGEISLDFETSTAEILRLADWDTTISNFYARKVIQYLLGCDNDKLPKEAMFAFEEI